jgi:hypothetical protein
LLAPVRANLARAAASLPPAGTRPSAGAAPLSPPLSFTSYGTPEGFAVIDARDLTDSPATPGEFVWVSEGPGNDLLQCLRATAPGVDPGARPRVTLPTRCPEVPGLTYVVAVRPAAYTAPVVREDQRRFEEGTVTLDVFVIRTATGTIERGLRVTATNGENVTFTAGRFRNAVDEDLRSAAKRVVYEALRAPPRPPPVTPPGFTRHEGEGWSIAVPSSWEASPPTVPDVTMALIDATPTAGFRRNLNATVRPYGGTLERAVSEVTSELGALVTIRSTTESTAGPFPSVEIEYVPPAGIPLHAVQSITMVGGRIWAMSCTGAEADFEALRPTCRAIFSSFSAD